jgi:hypothetical protein
MISTSKQATPDITIGNVARSLVSEHERAEPISWNEPKTLFPTDLKLNRKQEDAMCAHIVQWIKKLDGDLGRSDTSIDNGLPMFLGGELTLRREDQDMMARKFMCKRSLYELTAKNDVTWRKYLYKDSIFRQSNLTVPLSRRIAKQSAARAINYFFGTDPWLALHAVGASDTSLTKKLQRLLDIKFIESGSLATLRRGVAKAFDLGESIMKVIQTRQTKRFRETKVVAVDASGNPLLAQDGGPITETDLFILDDAGDQVLKRDGVTPMPAELVFAQTQLEQEITEYEGPEVTQIYYRDFMCPENAKDIQSAECVVHFVEMTASQIAELYLSSGNRDMDSLKRAVAMLKEAMSNTNASKTGDRGARAEQHQETSTENSEPVTEYAEVYIHYDADGDGVTEDIICLINPATGFPVYYDYVANVTDDHKRPFHVITAKPVQNRWYGQGIIEEFETHQTAIDLMYNRRNFNQSAAGRVTFFNPSATVEGDMDPNLKLNWGKTYRLKPNMLVDDVLKVVYLDDNKFEALTAEIEFIMQIAMNESGVQHANDAQAAGFDSAKLATGVRNIEKSGQEMFALPISEIESCLTPLCDAFTTTLYANLKDEETFVYLEDEVPQELTVAARDVAGLRFNVQVLLTRFRDEQVLQGTSQAAVLIREYYGYPPELQVIMAPLYRDMLKSLQIQKADNYIQPGVAMTAPMGPTGTPQAPGSASKTPPPNL